MIHFNDRPRHGGGTTMTLRKHHEDVAEFMGASDQVPSQECAALYFRLVREEYDELWDAWVRNGKSGHDIKPADIEETIDALADLIWVAYGMMLALGVGPDEAWKPVANANLSKIDAATGKVLKRADGKVLKPDGWEPPSHAHLVERVALILNANKKDEDAAAVTENGVPS